MASIGGTGSTNIKFDAGSVMPHEVNNAGGFKPSDYVSKGGSLAFSELKGGKRKSKKGSKKTSRKSSKKTSRKTSKKTAKRGKKTVKNALKGLFGLFKKK
jgi:hypothetical protein